MTETHKTTLYKATLSITLHPVFKGDSVVKIGITSQPRLIFLSGCFNIESNYRLCHVNFLIYQLFETS